MDGLIVGFDVPHDGEFITMGLICRCGSFYVKLHENKHVMVCCQCGGIDTFAMTKAEMDDKKDEVRWITQ